mgnify:CR=1 FL=1
MVKWVEAVSMDLLVSAKSVLRQQGFPHITPWTFSNIPPLTSSGQTTFPPPIARSKPQVHRTQEVRGGEGDQRLGSSDPHPMSHQVARYDL